MNLWSGVVGGPGRLLCGGGGADQQQPVRQWCGHLHQRRGAARQFQNEVKVGMIGINVPVPVPMAYYSFGGWKSYLFGDSHAHGMEGVHFFTRGKVITSRWLDPSHGGLNRGLPPERLSARFYCPVRARRLWSGHPAPPHARLARLVPEAQPARLVVRSSVTPKTGSRLPDAHRFKLSGSRPALVVRSSGTTSRHDRLAWRKPTRLGLSCVSAAPEDRIAPTRRSPL